MWALYTLSKSPIYSSLAVQRCAMCLPRCVRHVTHLGVISQRSLVSHLNTMVASLGRSPKSNRAMTEKAVMRCNLQDSEHILYHEACAGKGGHHMPDAKQLGSPQRTNFAYRNMLSNGESGSGGHRKRMGPSRLFGRLQEQPQGHHRPSARILPPRPLPRPKRSVIQGPRN